MSKRFTIRSAAARARQLPPAQSATARSDFSVPARVMSDADSDADGVARGALATWHAIDGALTPILGQHGTYALYKRSVVLTSATFAWLPVPHDDASLAMEFASLRTVLAQQPRAHAIAASDAMLHTMHALLHSLIGAALTEQLLHAVWAPPGSERQPPTMVP